jgi:hypothetical protein
VQRTDCDSDHNFHIGISCAYCTGQVDDDGEEVKEEEVKEGADEEKKEYKKKKSITEKYWDWELANDTKPIWVCMFVLQS